MLDESLRRRIYSSQVRTVASVEFQSCHQTTKGRDSGEADVEEKSCRESTEVEAFGQDITRPDEKWGWHGES